MRDELSTKIQRMGGYTQSPKYNQILSLSESSSSNLNYVQSVFKFLNTHSLTFLFKMTNSYMLSHIQIEED